MRACHSTPIYSLTLAVVTFAAHAAVGDILVDNLGEPTRAATVLGSAFPDDLWAAQAFSGPGCFVLDSIDVLVGDAAGSPDAAAELRVGADPSGPAVAVFTVPALPTVGSGIVTLIPDVAALIEPGETYWLVMGAATVGQFSWSYAEGNGSAGPGSFGAFTYSEDNGVTWGPQGVENPHQMRVNGTPSCQCPADLTGDGSVDFFDISLFLNLYNAQDPLADLAPPSGVWNFFDVSAYITAYNAGCP